MPHISQKYGQFQYFDIQLGHPIWRGKYVLDFGGNAGNILKDPASTIDIEKYHCIDIVPEAIEKGRRDYPAANWIAYDRYNISFHPTGSRSAEIPELGRRFDYILAYSVFTHVDVDEMDHLTERLLSLLNPGGAFAFTFIDPGNGNFEHRLERTNLDGSLLQTVEHAPWFRLAGADVYLEDDPIPNPATYEGKQYHVFHTVEFMTGHFPAAEILPPANGEVQHCCLLRRS